MKKYESFNIDRHCDKGFSLVVGDALSGKTSICNEIIDRVKDSEFSNNIVVLTDDKHYQFYKNKEVCDVYLSLNEFTSMLAEYMRLWDIENQNRLCVIVDGFADAKSFYSNRIICDTILNGRRKGVKFVCTIQNNTVLDEEIRFALETIFILTYKSREYVELMLNNCTGPLFVSSNISIKKALDDLAGFVDEYTRNSLVYTKGYLLCNKQTDIDSIMKHKTVPVCILDIDVLSYGSDDEMSDVKSNGTCYQTVEEEQTTSYDSDEGPFSGPVYVNSSAQQCDDNAYPSIDTGLLCSQLSDKLSESTHTDSDTAVYAEPIYDPFIEYKSENSIYSNTIHGKTVRRRNVSLSEQVTEIHHNKRSHTYELFDQNDGLYVCCGFSNAIYMFADIAALWFHKVKDSILF